LSEVDYRISTYPAKSEGYQSKKGLHGVITAYISNLWSITKEWSTEKDLDHFELFVDYINIIFIHERYCLERAFQKIKIKGGMCKPCCILHIAYNTIEFLFGLTFEGVQT